MIDNSLLISASAWPRADIADCFSTLPRTVGVSTFVWKTQAGIKKVIFNDPATIVIWDDGEKTVVKAHNEKYDPEKGLAMAIAKRYFGNKGNYFNHLKPWLVEEEKKQRLMDFDKWLEELGKEYE